MMYTDGPGGTMVKNRKRLCKKSKEGRKKDLSR